MKILNFGSLNIDHVYQVEHFVKPGETLSTKSYKIFCGGKGLNQSIALARAGANVFHAGQIGKDGQILMELLTNNQINTDHIHVSKIPTGHAIIQVNQDGENCILLHGGSNQQITKEQIKNVLQDFSKEDILLLQNETNEIPFLIEEASKKGISIVFNPAPMTSDVLNYPLAKISILILNEVEAEELSTIKGHPKDMAELIYKRYKIPEIIITKGKKGVYYYDCKSEEIHFPAESVNAVDTTAAGDCFIGYFLASYSQKKNIQEALEIANKAASISVTRNGAAESIPSKQEVFND